MPCLITLFAAALKASSSIAEPVVAVLKLSINSGAAELRRSVIGPLKTLEIPAVAMSRNKLDGSMLPVVISCDAAEVIALEVTEAIVVPVPAEERAEEM